MVISTAPSMARVGAGEDDRPVGVSALVDGAALDVVPPVEELLGGPPVATAKKQRRTLKYPQEFTLRPGQQRTFLGSTFALKLGGVVAGFLTIDDVEVRHTLVTQIAPVQPVAQGPAYSARLCAAPKKNGPVVPPKWLFRIPNFAEFHLTEVEGGVRFEVVSVNDKIDDRLLAERETIPVSGTGIDRMPHRTA